MDLGSNVSEFLPRKRKNSRTGRTGQNRKKRKVFESDDFMEGDDKIEDVIPEFIQFIVVHYKRYIILIIKFSVTVCAHARLLHE